MTASTWSRCPSRGPIGTCSGSGSPACSGSTRTGYVTDGLGGNESLGLESAELMRRVNAHLARSKGGTRGYNPNFKHRLAKEVLAARRAEESTLALPPAVHEWAGAVAEEHIEAVRSSGVAVIGDLEDLRPSAPRDGRQPGDLSDAELLDTAVAALVGLARVAGTSQRTRAAAPARPGGRGAGAGAPGCAPGCAACSAGLNARTITDRDVSRVPKALNSHANHMSTQRRACLTCPPLCLELMLVCRL